MKSSHKFINTIFSHTIYDNYMIKSTSDCLSKVFPQEVKYEYTMKISSTKKLLHALYTKTMRLNQQVDVFHKFINTIFSVLYTTICGEVQCLSLKSLSTIGYHLNNMQ